MQDSSTIHILLCPLDWGLGHTTRLWALAMKLRKVKNVRFFWAVNGKPKQWLLAQKEAFPSDDVILDIPFIPVKHDGTFGGFVKQMPAFILRIHRLRKAIAKLVKAHQIHGIISDHQFGAWHKNIPCILVAHQLRLPVFQKISWLSNIIDRFHSSYINQFKEVWIPDLEGEKGLSGKLSNTSLLKIPHHFIGHLSHLAESENYADGLENNIDVLGMVSGPEPFRARMEEEITQWLKSNGKKNVMIGGSYNKKRNSRHDDNLTYYHSLDSIKIGTLIQRSSLVVASGGYSTLMDLMLLQKSAILIPTPGQPEQAYLAKHLEAHPHFHFTSIEGLKDLDIQSVKEKLSNIRTVRGYPSKDDFILAAFKSAMVI
jgi:UDP:flavonoid glycosyltransferase YjiC (YdhE family)